MAKKIDEKTAKALKEIGINAKSEEDARKQLLKILADNEIEGMEDEDLSTLIDIAEAFVNEDGGSSEEDENDNLAKEVDDEDSDDDGDDDTDEDDDDTDGGDELDDMDRTELKAYIKENELDVKVKKAWSDDEIREAIRAAEAEGGEEEEQEDEEPEPEPEPEPKKTTKKEEAAPSIENKAAATTLGDIDALAALKEQLEGKK